MPYRLEISKTNRAVCKNTECKKEGVKIQKGELRFGTLIPFQETQYWGWKHWGCVTPKQIANLLEGIEGNYDFLDGYDELPALAQETVHTAFEQGHVSDSEWKGDVEKNRPGQNGYRTPKKKAPKTEENQEDEASPSKPAPKKRGRAKKEEAEASAEEDSKPPAKKARAKAIKVEEVDEARNAPDQDPAPKKAKGRGRKKVKQEDDDGSGDDYEPAPKKAKGRGKVKQEDSDAGDHLQVVPKRAKRPRKQAKLEENDENDENQELTSPREADVPVKHEENDEGAEDHAPEPKKAKGRAKKPKVEDGENQKAVPTRARGRPKKTATAAEPVASGNPEPELSEVNGEQEEMAEPVRPKRTRKKTDNSQTSNGSKAKTKKK